MNLILLIHSTNYKLKFYHKALYKHTPKFQTKPQQSEILIIPNKQSVKLKYHSVCMTLST